MVEDDIDAFKNAINSAINQLNIKVRTRQIDTYLSLINQIDPLKRNTKAEIVILRKKEIAATLPQLTNGSIKGRGRTWFNSLTNHAVSISIYPSVLVADVNFAGNKTRFIAVVTNSKNRFPRNRNGEVGLQEGWAMAKYIREAIDEDAQSDTKRNIVAVIDVPSQAYGYNEELLGIHFSCAASVDAYASARIAGHAVTGLIVGNAISGAFLSHGLQCSRLIALDDAQINVQAMSKQSAARVTKRTIAELEEATKKVPAMAYDIKNFYSLGPLDSLIEGVNADEPSETDVEKVITKLTLAIKAADNTLKHRLETPQAIEKGRIYSILVRNKISELWS